MRIWIRMTAVVVGLTMTTALSSASSRGVENYALSFDGNDLVTFGTVPTLPDTFTFEAWLNATEALASGVVVGHAAGPGNQTPDLSG